MGKKTQAKLAAFFGGEYEVREFDFPLTYTKERFLARSLSSSYAPDPASAKYAAYRAALGQLLDEYSRRGDHRRQPHGGGVRQHREKCADITYSNTNLRAVLHIPLSHRAD